MSRKSDVQSVIYRYTQRLQKLKEMRARKGMDTPPHVLIEIEDIENQIEALNQELTVLPDDEPDLPDMLLAEPSLPKSTDTEINISTNIQGDFVTGSKQTIDTGGAPHLQDTIIKSGGGRIEIVGTKTVLMISIPLVVVILVIMVSTINLADAIQWARQSGHILAPLIPLPTNTPTPPSPMAENFFNIGVAQLPEVSNTGVLTVTETSREFSNFLFTVIKNTSNQPGLAAQVRGPDLIGPISGADFAARSSVAEQVSDVHHINFLIYGLITRTTGGGYRAELEFYLSHRGFDYGSEITGPEQLGRSIDFSLPLNSPATKNQLSSRLQILQHTVEGLHYFYFGNYEQAWAKFYQASIANKASGLDDLPVLHLLAGAAKLQSYGPKLAADKGAELLNQAEAEFLRAYELDPDYSRSHLGLGMVTFQQANLTTPVDATKLNKAEEWYTRSLDTANQSALIREKATFGLGQIHLAGFMAGLPDWTEQQALMSFDQVISAHNTTQAEPLAELAGHAHAYRGWLAGNNGNWQDMATEFYAANTLLGSIPGHPPKDWLALYWSYAAQAEEHLGNLTNAREAYFQAVNLGEQVVEPGAFGPEDLEKWRENLARLEKGNP